MRYFTEEELSRVTHPTEGVEGLKASTYYSPLLLTMLDDLRHRAGIPVLLTSGYRCSEYNKKIGGSPTSSHLKGLAMDISCSDTSHRFLYIRAAIAAGFTRIGIGKTYLHLDIDQSKPAGLMWLY